MSQPQGQLAKQLKIKAGAVKRINNEYFGYQSEEQKQRDRIQKLKDQNADEHDINKQNEVLQETLLMYPNIIQRLKDQITDLEQFLEENSKDPEIEGSEELGQSMQILDKSKEFLTTVN